MNLSERSIVQTSFDLRLEPKSFPAAIDVLEIASPHSLHVIRLPEQESGLIIAQNGLSSRDYKVGPDKVPRSVALNNYRSRQFPFTVLLQAPSMPVRHALDLLLRHFRIEIPMVSLLFLLSGRRELPAGAANRSELLALNEETCPQG